MSSEQEKEGFRALAVIGTGIACVGLAVAAPLTVPVLMSTFGVVTAGTGTAFVGTSGALISAIQAGTVGTALATTGVATTAVGAKVAHDNLGKKKGGSFFGSFFS